MNTEYIDLYYAPHGASDPAQFTGELRRWAESAKKRKLIRFFGFSTHKNMAKCLAAAARLNWIDVIMTSYNFQLMEDAAMKAAIEACYKAGIGLVAMKTQAGGYHQEHRLSLNPHQAALKWILDLSFVDCAIPGMVNRQQLLENSGVIGMKLGWSDRKILSAYYDTIKDHYCLGCGACSSSCTKAVDIHTIHRSLMYWEGYQDFGLGQKTYWRLPTSENALACISCSKPTCKCINGIKISERMRYAHTAFI